MLALLQITPAFVREAFALLRSSIIHVEQDDIDFEDDEDVVAPTGDADLDGDVAMDDADIAALDQVESSYKNSSLLNGNGSSSLAGPSSQPAASASSAPAAPTQKKKTKITCECDLPNRSNAL